MRLLSYLLLSAILFVGCAPQSPNGSITQEQREIVRIETYLRAWKYLTKRVNAQMDPEDKAALELFRKDWNIPASEPRRTVLAYLSRKHPATLGTEAYPVEGTTCTTPNPYPQPSETASWTGGCKNGKIDGTGKLTWRFLRRGEWAEQHTEGTLVNGLFNGPGRTVSPGEYVYEGNYKDHKHHGLGTLIRDNGWKYEGLWQDSRPHGQGTVTSPSGEQFSGVFRKGCLPGPTGGYIAFNTNEAQCERDAKAAG